MKFAYQVTVKPEDVQAVLRMLVESDVLLSEDFLLGLLRAREHHFDRARRDAEDGV